RSYGDWSSDVCSSISAGGGNATRIGAKPCLVPQLDVAGDVQVQPSVPVDVGEGGASLPLVRARDGETTGRRHLAETAALLVVIRSEERRVGKECRWGR